MDNPGTGVDIAVDGGQLWNINTYAAAESVNPIDPSDNYGTGYGQITFSVRDKPAVKTWIDKPISLTDGANGETTGIIQGASGNGTKADITANSRLGLAAVTRQAQPYVGTLGGAIRYYLGLCSITTGIIIDPALENVPVKLIGWKGVVYDQLQKLGVARSFELSLVSNNIIIRPLRTRNAETIRNSAVSWALDSANLAQFVEGYSYNPSNGADLVYPKGGWNTDVTVYSVKAGDTYKVNIPVDCSIQTLDQPVCVAFVDRNYTAGSVYSVSGGDGIAIQPAQWVNTGGSLAVAIGEDGKSIDLTVVASRDTQYSPYSIAVSAGPGDFYSSLRIRGTGVFYNKKLLTLPANLNPDKAPQMTGATVDNEFYEREDDLYHALLWSAARFTNARLTLKVTTRGINRAGDSGSQRYPTIDDVEDIYGPATIQERYSDLGPTIDDWNEALFSKVRGSFENQAFGNVAGARVLLEDCYYRIRSATVSPLKVDYSAEWDTTVRDATPGVETIAQWNARWGDQGLLISDYNAAPMRGVAV